jgi:hypothetical protein
VELFEIKPSNHRRYPDELKASSNQFEAFEEGSMMKLGRRLGCSVQLPNGGANKHEPISERDFRDDF